MTYLESQLLVVQAQVMYRHAEIVSGAYKLRNIYRSRDGEEIELTDDEKLRDSMGVLSRQCSRLLELSDAIGEREHPSKFDPEDALA